MALSQFHLRNELQLIRSELNLIGRIFENPETSEGERNLLVRKRVHLQARFRQLVGEGA